MSAGERVTEEPSAPVGSLVPFASYTEQLAAGFALVALVVVPERVLLWSLRDPADRIAGGALMVQLVALPLVAAGAAALGGWLRDRKRTFIYAGLPDVTHEDPEDVEVVDDPDELRGIVRRVVLRVGLLWFVAGLVVPFMASSITALAGYAWVVGRWEARAKARDGRELLTRPRWFIWLPVAWRTVSG